MDSYELTNMIIDEQYEQEHVTANFKYKQKEYSITFTKSDLELINAWVFENKTSYPANLTDDELEEIRENIKKHL